MEGGGWTCEFTIFSYLLQKQIVGQKEYVVLSRKNDIPAILSIITIQSVSLDNLDLLGSPAINNVLIKEFQLEN